MNLETFALEGRHVRLEPLEPRHIDGLVAAAAADPSLYQWTVVPQSSEGMTQYVETALAARRAGTAMPFATLSLATGAVIGCTRYFDIERWAWPAGHPMAARTAPDVCEIGYTWLTRPAIRTAVNTEAKLLMLTHAFETWNVFRVCLHTDARNAQSRAAILRIGAQFEGILRAHRLAADITPRNSARYSIVAEEWPRVRERLEAMRERQPA
jgi:RimJ/RimL family protein N-acetyltransferase